MSTTELLFEDLWVEVFKQLEPEHVARSCSLVCKNWHDAASSQMLWKYFCVQEEISADEIEQDWKVLYRQGSIFICIIACFLIP